MILLPSIIYNCNKATVLVLKKQSERIGLTERLRLTLHLRNCESCRRFMHQSSLIDETIKNTAIALFEKPVFHLSDGAKTRILESLKSS